MEKPDATDVLNIFDFPVQHFPDRSARWLLQDKDNVRGLLEIIADELADRIDFTQLAALNRSFVSDTLREQESDLLFSVPFQGASETEEPLLIYILIEHQSTVDVSMGYRLLSYMMEIWASQRRAWESEGVSQSEWRFRLILPVVFYTGSRRWHAPLSLEALMDVPPGLSGFVPAFDVLFLNVSETAVSELTRSGHPFGWLLTVLQKEGSESSELLTVLSEALVHLKGAFGEAPEQLQRAILYFVLLILHRRPPRDHADLLGFLDRQVADMEVVEMAEVIADTLLEQGIEQGIEQGEIRAKRAAVLKLLQFRFGRVPESLQVQIAAIESGAALDTVFDAVLRAATLDDIAF